MPSSNSTVSILPIWLPLLVLFLVPAFPFAPTSKSIFTSKTRCKNTSILAAPPLHAHRNIVVLSHNVSQNMVDGMFEVNNLLTGRIDVLARCITSALWVSNGIRRDTTIFLMLFPHNITIEIQGEHVHGLNPDERTTALYLQRALLVGSAETEKEQQGEEKERLVSVVYPQKKDPASKYKRPETINPNKPGSRSKSEKLALRVTRKAQEAMLRRVHKSVGNNATSPRGFVLHRDDTLEARLTSLRKKNGSIFALNEIGEPLGNIFAKMDLETRREEETTLFLGDQIGYSLMDEELLANDKDVTQISLGPLSLLTSQCITITHHYLDTSRI
jgi:tRNA pseudouridine-54 N-methylase